MQHEETGMTSRRKFLQWGLAASALPLATGVVAAPTRPVMPPYYKLIFDERSPASRVWAGEARRLGLPTHGIKGDITALWFHDLDRRWKQGTTAIAGLTLESSLFCLELLARDRGMRLVYRTEHSINPEGQLEPALPSLHEWSWPNHLTGVEARVPSLVDNPQHLVAWVIAPKRIS
jgi:hypothetical protein